MPSKSNICIRVEVTPKQWEILYCIVILIGTLKSMSLTIHQRIKLHTSCGGDQLSVGLQQGGVSCKTGGNAEGKFLSGARITWSSFGDCAGKEFDLEDMVVLFSLLASSGDNYCPNTLRITFKVDGFNKYVDYRCQISDAILDNADNQRTFKAYRWGKLDGDLDRQKTMYSYAG